MVKIYGSGMEFLTENQPIIDRYPMDMAFFEKNAKSMPDNQDGFSIRIEEGDRLLLAIRYLEFPMVLFGAEELCGRLAKALLRNGLTFGKVLGKGSLPEAFLSRYEAMTGGSHRIHMSMMTMTCTDFHGCDTTGVFHASTAEVPEILALTEKFYQEALQETIAQEKTEEHMTRIRAEISNYACIRREGKLVSMAKTTREAERLCCISAVYTLPEYRGQGLARQIVTALTAEILERKKIPYLYVDQENPVSNHLYQSIGYTYDAPQMEIEYFPKQ